MDNDTHFYILCLAPYKPAEIQNEYAAKKPRLTTNNIVCGNSSAIQPNRTDTHAARNLAHV